MSERPSCAATTASTSRACPRGVAPCSSSERSAASLRRDEEDEPPRSSQPAMLPSLQPHLLQLGREPTDKLSVPAERLILELGGDHVAARRLAPAARRLIHLGEHLLGEPHAPLVGRLCLLLLLRLLRRLGRRGERSFLAV
eukprot:scaffold108441_cov25-Tisochrysis_lutea.AAC.1